MFRYNKIFFQEENFEVGTKFVGAKNSTIEIVDIPKESSTIKVRYISSDGRIGKKLYDYNRNAAINRVATHFISNKKTETPLWKVLNDKA